MASLSEVPFRDTFWNVPRWAQFLLYALSVVAIGVFALGMWQRIALWREGSPSTRLDRIPERIRFLVRARLARAGSSRSAYPGVMHALMFWGFLRPVHGHRPRHDRLRHHARSRCFDFKLLQGPFYLFYELSLDLFGLFFVVGLGHGALPPVRRAPGPDRPDARTSPGSSPCSS